MSLIIGEIFLGNSVLYFYSLFAFALYCCLWGFFFICCLRVLFHSTDCIAKSTNTSVKKYSVATFVMLQRFNVAVTRAKALLIVIGNPNIVRHNKSWNRCVQMLQSLLESIVRCSQLFPSFLLIYV